MESNNSDLENTNDSDENIIQDYESTIDPQVNGQQSEDAEESEADQEEVYLEELERTRQNARLMQDRAQAAQAAAVAELEQLNLNSEGNESENENNDNGSTSTNSFEDERYFVEPVQDQSLESTLYQHPVPDSETATPPITPAHQYRQLSPTQVQENDSPLPETRETSWHFRAPPPSRNETPVRSPIIEPRTPDQPSRYRNIFNSPTPPIDQTPDRGDFHSYSPPPPPPVRSNRGNTSDSDSDFNDLNNTIGFRAARGIGNIMAPIPSHSSQQTFSTQNRTESVGSLGSLSSVHNVAPLGNSNSRPSSPASINNFFGSTDTINPIITPNSQMINPTLDSDDSNDTKISKKNKLLELQSNSDCNIIGIYSMKKYESDEEDTDDFINVKDINGINIHTSKMEYQHTTLGSYSDGVDETVDFAHNLFSGFDFSKCGNNILIYGTNRQHIFELSSRGDSPLVSNWVYNNLETRFKGKHETSKDLILTKSLYGTNNDDENIIVSLYRKRDILASNKDDNDWIFIANETNLLNDSFKNDYGLINVWSNKISLNFFGCETFTLSRKTNYYNKNLQIIVYSREGHIQIYEVVKTGSIIVNYGTYYTVIYQDITNYVGNFAFERFEIPQFSFNFDNTKISLCRKLETQMHRIQTIIDPPKSGQGQCSGMELFYKGHDGYESLSDRITEFSDRNNIYPIQNIKSASFSPHHPDLLLITTGTFIYDNGPPSDHNLIVYGSVYILDISNLQDYAKGLFAKWSWPKRIPTNPEVAGISNSSYIINSADFCQSNYYNSTTFFMNWMGAANSRQYVEIYKYSNFDQVSQIKFITLENDNIIYDIQLKPPKRLTYVPNRFNNKEKNDIDEFFNKIHKKLKNNRESDELMIPTINPEYLFCGIEEDKSTTKMIKHLISFANKHHGIITGDFALLYAELSMGMDIRKTIPTNEEKVKQRLRYPSNMQIIFNIPRKFNHETSIHDNNMEAIIAEFNIFFGKFQKMFTSTTSGLEDFSECLYYDFYIHYSLNQSVGPGLDFLGHKCMKKTYINTNLANDGQLNEGYYYNLNVRNNTLSLVIKTVELIFIYGVENNDIQDLIRYMYAYSANHCYLKTNKKDKKLFVHFLDNNVKNNIKQRLLKHTEYSIYDSNSPISTQYPYNYFLSNIDKSYEFILKGYLPNNWKNFVLKQKQNMFESICLTYKTCALEIQIEDLKVNLDEIKEYSNKYNLFYTEKPAKKSKMKHCIYSTKDNNYLRNLGVGDIVKIEYWVEENGDNIQTFPYKRPTIFVNNRNWKSSNLPGFVSIYRISLNENKRNKYFNKLQKFSENMKLMGKSGTILGKENSGVLLYQSYFWEELCNILDSSERIIPMYYREYSGMTIESFLRKSRDHHNAGQLLKLLEENAVHNINDRSNESSINSNEYNSAESKEDIGVAESKEDMGVAESKEDIGVAESKKDEKEETILIEEKSENIIKNKSENSLASFGTESYGTDEELAAISKNMGYREPIKSILKKNINKQIDITEISDFLINYREIVNHIVAINERLVDDRLTVLPGVNENYRRIICNEMISSWLKPYDVCYTANKLLTANEIITHNRQFETSNIAQTGRDHNHNFKLKGQQLFKTKIRIWKSNYKNKEIIEEYKNNNWILTWSDRGEYIQLDEYYRDILGMQKYQALHQFACTWDSFVTGIHWDIMVMNPDDGRYVKEFFVEYNFGIQVGESEESKRERAASPTFQSHADLIDWGGISKTFFSDICQEFKSQIKNNSFFTKHIVDLEEDNIDKISLSSKIIYERRTFFQLPLWKRLLFIMILASVNDCSKYLNIDDELLNLVFVNDFNKNKDSKDKTKNTIPIIKLICGSGLVSYPYTFKTKETTKPNIDHNLKILCRFLKSETECDFIEKLTDEMAEKDNLPKYNEFFSDNIFLNSGESDIDNFTILLRNFLNILYVPTNQPPSIRMSPISLPISESLPYNGDLQAAMKAQDRDAIRKIMNVRNKSPSPQPTIDIQDSENAAIAAYNASQDNYKRIYVDNVISKFIGFRRDLNFYLLYYNPKFCYDDILSTYESLDTRFYLNICQFIHLVKLNSENVRKTILVQLERASKEEYRLAESQMNNISLDVIEQIHKYLQSMLIRYVEQISIDVNQQPPYLEDFINYYSGTSSLPNNIVFNIEYKNSEEIGGFNLPVSHSCLNLITFTLNYNTQISFKEMLPSYELFKSKLDEAIMLTEMSGDFLIDNESDNTSTVESTTPQIVAEQRLNGGSRNWFFNLFT